MTAKLTPLAALAWEGLGRAGIPVPLPYKMATAIMLMGASFMAA